VALAYGANAVSNLIAWGYGFSLGLTCRRNRGPAAAEHRGLGEFYSARPSCDPYRVAPEEIPLATFLNAQQMTTNEFTSLDAALTLLFHVVARSRGASELIRSAKDYQGVWLT